MIVVGVDGATWDFILPHLDDLPTFKHLIEKYKFGVLECDVRPVHSAPSWTTIFTGVAPEVHGVRDFVVDDAERKTLLDKNLFIWQRVRDAVCLDLPVAFPPLNSGASLPDWQKVILSITADEMLESTKITLDTSLSHLKERVPSFFSVVFYETDRAQHFFWREPKKLLPHYQSVDCALSAFLPYFETNDFLVLSDHGFTDATVTKSLGWDAMKGKHTGGHHPYGIAISNRTPPAKVTDVYGFMAAGL